MSDARPYKLALVGPDDVMWYEVRDVVASTLWRANETPGAIVCMGMTRDGLEQVAAALNAAGFGVALWPREDPGA